MESRAQATSVVRRVFATLLGLDSAFLVALVASASFEWLSSGRSVSIVAGLGSATQADNGNEMPL